MKICIENKIYIHAIYNMCRIASTCFLFDSEWYEQLVRKASRRGCLSEMLWRMRHWAGCTGCSQALATHFHIVAISFYCELKLDLVQKFCVLTIYMLVYMCLSIGFIIGLIHFRDTIKCTKLNGNLDIFMGLFFIKQKPMWNVHSYFWIELLWREILFINWRLLCWSNYYFEIIL